MSWRIIDISQDGRYLHADRQWLVIKDSAAEIGRVPLTDVQSILVHAAHGTYSHGLLLRLADHDIPLALCDNRHVPVSYMLPLDGHHRHAGRARAQCEASQPTRKRIWQQLIRAKIAEQARSLSDKDPVGQQSLENLLTKVRAGDPDNIEARAARYYWRRLFGSDFRRDRTQGGLNAHLNYGYTILRSALARAVVAAGLIPSLGVGHINMRNNMGLIDDLMEPFRPLVDRLVLKNVDQWQGDISPESRAELAGIMAQSINTPNGESDLFRTMTLVVNSLVAVFEGQARDLILPKEIAFVTMPSLPGLEES